MKTVCKKDESVGPFKVAVLLASYNGCKYIETQIESILNQALCEIKVVVSDDHSTDSTLEKVRILTDRYPGQITWSLTESRKGSAGKNFYELIVNNSLEGFDFVAFADQDDIWQQNHLSSSIGICISKNCDAVSSNVLALLPDGTLKMCKKNQPQRRYDFLFESPGPGCTFVIRMALFRYVRKVLCEYREKIDQVFHHDWLVYAIARSSGFKWFIRDQPLVHYRQHQTNETGARIGMRGWIVRYRKMTSGWYAEQISNVALIVDLIGLMKSDPVLRCLIDQNNRLLLFKWSNQARRSFEDRCIFGLYILFDLIRWPR